MDGQAKTAGAFSIAEFCRAFSISRSTAYGEIRRGRLESFKIGRRRLISAAAAAAWLTACKTEASAERTVV